ncbi:MAG: hypothetical protein WAV30_04315, partial [Microgenomates group bacterium]
LKRLDITDGTYKFEATTIDPETIRIYLARLRQEKRFKSIVIGSIRRTGLEFIVPFTLSDFQLVTIKK